MARQSGIWQRKGRKGWHCWHNGKIVKLADKRSDAMQAFYKLKGGSAKPTLPGMAETFVKLMDQYLDWVQGNLAEGTYRNHFGILTSFAKALPHKGSDAPLSITPIMVYRWVESQKGWGPSTRNRNVSSLQACFNWGVEHDIIAKSPIRKLRKATYQSREIRLTVEQRQAVLAACCNQDHRDYIRFLELTGCRVQEIRVLKPSDWRDGQQAFVIQKSEVKGKRAVRIIHCTDEAASIVRRRMQTCKQYVFEQTNGKPWVKDRVTTMMKRLRERTGIEKLPATAYRHTFASDAIEKGVDPFTVALLMGHTSTAMVSENYGHLSAGHLADAVKRFR